MDLFSGIGGFALAARWAGINTISFCEIDPFCQKVLAKNFPGVPIYEDIRELWEHSVNLITGGFPCQPFSHAGKKRGKNDNRYLWDEFYRIIRISHPDWVIAENVTGIVGMELDNILDDLAREGYDSQTFIIPACAANAPHRRDRIWIIANAMRKRCDNGVYYWESRHIQKDKKWDMETLHSEWTQFIPQSWQTFKVRDWFQFNSKSCRGNDGISSRLDKHRIKVLGNSIVPQIVYVLMKAINEVEKPRE